MGETPRDEGIPDRYDLPEKALGGADAVPDTNYVPPHPGPETPKGKGPVGATVSAGNRTVWAIVALLFAGAVLVYLLWLFGIGQ